MNALRNILSSLLIAVIFVSIGFSQQQDELAIGSKAPMTEQKMATVSGEEITLNEAAQENGLVVIFSCNTCPWVVRWEDRYPMVADIASENGIGMIALNPNENYRERGDGMKDMVDRAKKMKYNFTYALDKDHELADAFGATRTPHVYLFNSEMELVYVGAIDDNAADANEVKEFYLKDAIDQMISGKEVKVSKTKSLGCTIKRVS